MPNKQTWSFEIRVHTCPQCGAPCEIPLGSGQIKCAYCGVSMTFSARDAASARKPLESTAIAEPDRLERLKGQVASMDTRSWPPRDLLRYFSNRTLGSPELANEARREWNEQRRAVENGARGDAEVRLYWLTVAMRGLDSSDDGLLRCRAMCETAAELIEEPTLKARLRISLAGYAAHDDDLEAAEHWLSSVDPRSSEIAVHTDYALAMAAVALRRGSYADVFKYIGEAPGQVPLHLTAGARALLLRAAAYESQGNTRAAVEALSAGSLLSKLLGAKQLDNHVKYYAFEGRCCQKSYPLYKSHAKRTRAVFWGSAVIFVIVVMALMVL